MRLVYSQYCLILLFFFGVAEDHFTEDSEIDGFLPIVSSPDTTVGIGERVAARRNRMRLEDAYSVYDEETETDPEDIERRRVFRIEVRKFGFVLTCLLFGALLLPILVRNGFVRID